jgi:ATP-dependent Lon protease
MPRRNKKDIEEIPKKVQKEIRFHFADNMPEVLKIALNK